MRSTDSTLIVRTARKAWRCICADPIRRWEVRGTYGGDARTSTYYYSEAEAIADHAAKVSGRKFGREGVPFDEVEIVAEPNPNYRAECEGDAPPGTEYVEYVGEAPPYSHGSTYCATCAVAVWDEVEA